MLPFSLATVANLLLLLLPVACGVSQCLTCTSVNMDDKACEEGLPGTR